MRSGKAKVSFGFTSTGSDVDKSRSGKAKFKCRLDKGTFS